MSSQDSAFCWYRLTVSLVQVLPHFSSDGDAVVAAFTSQQEDSTDMFRQVESFFAKSRQGLTDIGLSTNPGFFCARQMFDHVCPFEVKE